MTQPQGQRPTRRRHWIGPNRLVTWRAAKTLLRREAPHAGQGGPEGGRTGGSCKPGLDEVASEHAGPLPRRQDQGGQGVGVFDCTQKTLHSGIIVAYAVVKPYNRPAASSR